MNPERNLKSIKIKGVITPYTPRGTTRVVPGDKLPLRKSELPKYGKVITLIINGRRCKLGYPHYCPKGSYYISPLDKSALPKKPRITELFAEDIYIKFCQTKDWCSLLHDWEGCRYLYFRRHLVELLLLKTDCDNCAVRFKCFSQKCNKPENYNPYKWGKYAAPCDKK